MPPTKVRFIWPAVSEENIFKTLANQKHGIYGYRSHNFNIIPRELDSTGKKIETDTTLELKLHIVLDKSSDITTTFP
jgi:hypothetical protein